MLRCSEQQGTRTRFNISIFRCFYTIPLTIMHHIFLLCLSFFRTETFSSLFVCFADFFFFLAQTRSGLPKGRLQKIKPTASNCQTTSQTSKCCLLWMSKPLKDQRTLSVATLVSEQTDFWRHITQVKLTYLFSLMITVRDIHSLQFKNWSGISLVYDM